MLHPSVHRMQNTSAIFSLEIIRGEEMFWFFTAIQMEHKPHNLNYFQTFTCLGCLLGKKILPIHKFQNKKMHNPEKQWRWICGCCCCWSAAKDQYRLCKQHKILGMKTRWWLPQKSRKKKMSKGKCVCGSGRLAGHFTHRKCLYINIFLIFWIVVIFRIGIKKSPSVQGRQRHTVAILWMFFYSKLIRRAHEVPHFLKGYF